VAYYKKCSIPRNVVLMIKIQGSPKDGYLVDAVLAALDVLNLFEDRDLTLAEISERLQINKSRVFRLLCTLAHRGYVEKSADGSRYRLGVKLVERAAFIHRDLRQIALPFMHMLLSEFNETVNLAILDREEVLYIEVLESSQPFRMVGSLGNRDALHCTALGKAILAYLPENDQVGILSQVEFSRFTPKTIHTLNDLTIELQKIRARGYSIDNEENDPGVGCISVPLFNNSNKPVAAISLSGPVNRVLGNQLDIVASLLKKSAEISGLLSFKVPA
jgi:IclR family KDG regulon transcriptional repressor